MTHQAATALDVRLRLLAERPDDAAALVVPDVVIGSPRSAADLEAFAAGCDVVTFDHELVDGAALERLERAGHRLHPTAATVAIAQDKLAQRTRFAAAGLPVPAFRAVRGVEDLLAFGDDQGWPIMAKAVRGGYDGRGVWRLDGERAAFDLWSSFAHTGVDLLAEAHVPLDREIAVLIARRPGGEVAPYAVVETVQRDGICRELLVPAAIPPAVAAAAGALARQAAEAVAVVGLLALELFVVGDRLLVNEIAARPHNSGHWTIEGAVTSQFEQHLRAILDWPLGAPDLAAPAVATVNLLGAADGRDPRSGLTLALTDPAVRVHLYGKSPRPGRKLGHVTVLAGSLAEARSRAGTAATHLVGGHHVVQGER
jgi:5-(carboxyamino)imidazole ribonucleotide synthase